MSFVFVGVIVWAIASIVKKATRKTARLPQHRTQPDTVEVIAPSPATMAEIRRRQKEREALHKKWNEQQIARNDLDRYAAERETLMRLLDAITAELEGDPDSRRTTTLLSRQASVEAKLHTLERKIERAYFTAFQAV